MSHVIERDWIANAGLRAICVLVQRAGRNSHRCGYVEVPEGHCLHGVGYSDQIDCITQDMVDSAQLGKKSPILILTAGVNSDGDRLVRRSLDVLIDVHGGITYANGGRGYPAESAGWWFGFDCAHSGDAEVDPDPRYQRDGEVRTLDYVVAECESMAQQISALTAPALQRLGV